MFKKFANVFSRKGSYTPKLEDTSVVVEGKNFSKNPEPFGKGGDGYVFSGENSETLQAVAIKFIPLNSDKKIKKEQQQDLEIFKSVNHPNIVTFLAGEEFPTMIVIAMELLSKGSIEKNLPSDGYSSLIYMKILLDISSALKYLHGKRIVHGDVKDANILHGENDTFKLCDFGAAAKLDEQPLSQYGTPQYAPPESYKKEGLSYSSDIWAFGIVLIRCATGKFPFLISSIFDFMEMINKNSIEYDPGFQQKHRQLHSVVVHMLNFNPEKRVSAARVHSFAESVVRPKMTV
jgi:protein-serine/threonine kinase